MLQVPRTKRVLIVDDESAIREVTRDLLLKFNVATEVKEAGTGQEALEEVERWSPDLILLDVKMPQMTGWEVCRKLKDDPKTRLIPVILVTSLETLEDRVRGIEAGADDFLTKPFHTEELLARASSLLRLKHYTDELDNAEALLFSLALGIEARDEGTGRHCERLAFYGIEFGKKLKLSEEEIDALRKGGFLHDIGKIGIPDSVLLKEGKLTEKEWTVMRQHPVIGAKLCEPLRTLKLTIPIILHHHERWNGTGYPDKLKGEEIPLLARILQLADVYDALITKRPYKPAFPLAQAIEVMRREAEAGLMDPDLTLEFLDLIKKFPDIENGRLPQTGKSPPIENSFFKYRLEPGSDSMKKKGSDPWKKGSDPSEP